MKNLLKNRSIEKSIPELTDFNMITESYMNNHRDIIWSLLIQYGYLIFVTTNDEDTTSINGILKIKNEEIKKFIEKKFTNWKIYLYKKYENIIDYFLKNYDELKIKESLEGLIINQYNSTQNNFLDNYYFLIYSLLNLCNEYEVITKNDCNKNENFRELLFVNKIYLDKLNSSSGKNNKNDNSNDNNNENNKTTNDSSIIIYITIKKLIKTDIFEEGCIQALDDNEEFIFNDIKLKDTFDKIIKFGIAIIENKCDVIYEINYGNNFKKKKRRKYSSIYRRFI